MDQIAQLFIGILVAAATFAATLFSVAQTFRQDGRLRLGHGIAAASTLAVMASLSTGLWTLSQGLGAVLIAAGLAVFWLESGWNRALALVQVAFGAVVLAGIPFGG